MATIKLSSLVNVAFRSWMLRCSTLLLGSPGIGKTTLTREISELIGGAISETAGIELPVGHCEALLSGLENYDVSGMQMPGGVDSLGNPELRQARPMFLPDFNTAAPAGFVILDEALQGTRETVIAIATPLLEQRFGQTSLPELWCCIAISNRAQDASGAKPPPMQVVNRLIMLDVEYEFDATAKWMMRPDAHRPPRPEANLKVELNDEQREAVAKLILKMTVPAPVHPVMQSFAHSHPQFINVGAVPKDPLPYHTARSFALSDRILQQAALIQNDQDYLTRYPNATEFMLPLPAPSKDCTHDVVAWSMVEGAYGTQATTALKAHVLSAAKLPPYEHIVADPAGAPIPDEPAMRMCTTFMLAARASLKHAQAVGKYLCRLDPAMGRMGMQRLTARDPLFASVPSLGELSVKIGAAYSA